MKTHPLPKRCPHACKSGMTRPQIITCITSFSCLAFIWAAVIFLGAWKNGSDRSANILNIRNCQQAMRGHQMMTSATPGERFNRQDLEEFMQYPTMVNVEIGEYANAGVVQGESEDPAVDWSHIWLKPSDAGMPGGKFGHESYADVTGW